jgi:hypothetical protein
VTAAARMRGLQAQNSRWTAPKTLNPKPWRKESGKAPLLALRNCEERKIDSCVAGTKAQPSFSSTHSIVSLAPGVASLLRTAGEKSSLSTHEELCLPAYIVEVQSVNGSVRIFWQVRKHFKRTEQNPGKIVTYGGSAFAYMSQMYSSWILWIGEKASSLLLLGCNKEKKLWIGIFFLWKIFKVLRASQEAASAFAVSLICNGWNNGCVVFAEHQSELPTGTWRMMAPKSTCPQEGMLEGAL